MKCKYCNTPIKFQTRIVHGMTIQAWRHPNSKMFCEGASTLAEPERVGAR